MTDASIHLLEAASVAAAGFALLVVLAMAASALRTSLRPISVDPFRR